MALGDILRRQQEREAWVLVLKDPEWAERLRGASDPSAVLRERPNYPHLRRMAQDPRPEALQGLLNPPPEVRERWERERVARPPYRFWKVDERLWRSGQPKLLDVRDAGPAALVNLRQEATDSERYAGELGLGYLHLPVPDQHVPELPQVVQFLEFVQASAGPVLVHCHAGQGRTGVLVACYRIARGMAADEAVAVTDAEIRMRGMRPHQREWVLDWRQ